MKDLALKTPTKNAKKVEKLEFDIFDDGPREESLDSCIVETTEAEVDPELVELLELRKQFAGEVDITEGLRRGSSPLRRALIQCLA
jgi:hypothetical protein